jgi:hypothetical protein
MIKFRKHLFYWNKIILFEAEFVLALCGGFFILDHLEGKGGLAIAIAVILFIYAAAVQLHVWLGGSKSDC